MAATTTAPNNLLQTLKSKFPELIFTPSDEFRWSSSAQTVFYDTNDPNNTPVLLHETAHGVLGHHQYNYDIDLIKLEREAWNKAVALSNELNAPIDEEIIETALDSYRDWLHSRSTCPACGKNGAQASLDTYECLVCQQKWRVNDARNCGLKRRKL